MWIGREDSTFEKWLPVHIFLQVKTWIEEKKIAFGKR